MIKLYPLKDTHVDIFKKLFTDYYEELDCDEDIDHLLDEYVIADYKAGLIYIDLLDDGENTVGFVIYQIDGDDNEWNFKKGWGDIREIYITPSARGDGFGKFMLYSAETKLLEKGVKKIYALPFEDAEPFFTACGYNDSGEHNDDLDCCVFLKDTFKKECGCK
jgi:GNAT superfamily N-acetyltransferase